MIDDESDYFTTEGNTWLSEHEKNALRKREGELRDIRHASRKDRKITLDFAGRRVMEDDSAVDMYNVKDSVIQQVHYGAKSKAHSQEANFNDEDFGYLVNPTLTRPPPQVGSSYFCHNQMKLVCSSICILPVIIISDITALDNHFGAVFETQFDIDTLV